MYWCTGCRYISTERPFFRLKHKRLSHADPETNKHKYSPVERVQKVVVFMLCVLPLCAAGETRWRRRRRRWPVDICSWAPGTVSENHFQSRTRPEPLGIGDYSPVWLTWTGQSWISIACTASRPLSFHDLISVGFIFWTLKGAAEEDAVAVEPPDIHLFYSSSARSPLSAGISDFIKLRLQLGCYGSNQGSNLTIATNHKYISGINMHFTHTECLISKRWAERASSDWEIHELNMTLTVVQLNAPLFFYIKCNLWWIIYHNAVKPL